MQDYKSLCAAVAIFATLIDPKWDFYILTSVNSKSIGQIKGNLAVGAPTSWTCGANLVAIGPSLTEIMHMHFFL